MTSPLLLVSYVVWVANVVPIAVGIFLKKKNWVYVLAALQLFLSVLIIMLAQRGLA